jgi:hypothetical protein
MTGTNGRKCIGNSWNWEAAPYSGAIILRHAAVVVRTVASLRPPITRCWPGQPGTSWMTGNSSISSIFPSLVFSCSLIRLPVHYTHSYTSRYSAAVYPFFHPFLFPDCFDGWPSHFGTLGTPFSCIQWVGEWCGCGPAPWTFLSLYSASTIQSLYTSWYPIDSL